MQIRFLGHAAFELSDGDTSVLIDPFLSGNPEGGGRRGGSESGRDPADARARRPPRRHGRRSPSAAGADVVAIVELANELSGEGLEKVHDPNIGGTVKFDWGWVRLVPAWHTATTPGGTASTPAGLVIGFGGKVDLPPRRHRPLLGSAAAGPARRRSTWR